jgi:hypothetical protein
MQCRKTSVSERPGSDRSRLQVASSLDPLLADLAIRRATRRGLTTRRRLEAELPENAGEPVGIELFGPRRQLESEGTITVVLPSGERVRVLDAERLVRKAPAAEAA